MWYLVRIQLNHQQQTWSVSPDIQQSYRDFYVRGWHNFLHQQQLQQSRTEQPQDMLWFGRGEWLLFLDDFSFISCCITTAEIHQVQTLSRLHSGPCRKSHNGRWGRRSNVAATKSKLEGSHKITAGMQNIEVYWGGSFPSSKIFKHQLLKTEDFDSAGQLVKCTVRNNVLNLYL